MGSKHPKHGFIYPVNYGFVPGVIGGDGEELDAYLRKIGIRATYIHSDVDTLERIQILDDFRKGIYDVLVGVNLLREGLDLPEVSLVAILDADKEGFLRNQRSLTQTAGRAARNLNGKVIMYADKITDSMKLTIDESTRRRTIQLRYNEEHGITPQAIVKAHKQIIDGLHATAETQTIQSDGSPAKPIKYDQIPYYNEYVNTYNIAADPVAEFITKEDLPTIIDNLKKQMTKAAKDMDFLEAARLRDEIAKLTEKLDA